MRFRPDERLKYIEILIKSPQQVFEKEQQVKEVLFFMKLKTDLVIMGSGMAGISAADAALARGKHSKRQGISERSISFVI